MSYAARHESKPPIDSTPSRCLAGPSGAYLRAYQLPIPGGRDKGPDSGWRFNRRPAKLVHKEADSRPGGADDFRQRLLGDLGDYRFRLAFFSEVGQQQEHSRQPLLTRVEELIHQVLLDTNAACEQMRYKHFGKGRLFVEHRSEERRVGKEGRSR